MDSWANTAIRRIEADVQRSADTHLITVDLPALTDVRLYLKDESTPPTGSLKHRLSRWLFLYGPCNGWTRLVRSHRSVSPEIALSPIQHARYTVGMQIRHFRANTAARRRASLALILLLAGGLISACATVKQTTDKIKAVLPSSETVQVGRKTAAPAVEAPPATLPGADPGEATAPAKPAAPIVPAGTAVPTGLAGSIAPTPQAAPPIPRFGPRVAAEKAPVSPPSTGTASAPESAPAKATVNGPAWLSKCHSVQVAGGVVQCDADTLLARPSPKVRVFTSDPAQADTEADVTLRDGLPRRYRFFVVP